MLKRIFLTLILCGLMAPLVNAQLNFEVVSFEEDIMDITPRTHPRLDGDGEPAALLKIQVPMLTDAVITSPQKVGVQDYEPGEFHVYLSDGSKQVTIKHPDFEPFTYTFPQVLKGKNTYKMVLKIPEEYLSKGQMSVRFYTNVTNAHLEIEGQNLSTDNGEFIVRLKKGDYTYKLYTERPGFSPVEGTLAVTTDDIREMGRMDVYVELPSEKKSSLKLNVANGSNVKIDGKKVNLKKDDTVKLPFGTHYIDVELLGYTRTDTVELFKENEFRNIDISVPFTIVYPSTAEFTVTPKNGALKPTGTKFKAGQTVRLLGQYDIEVKAKDYEPLTFTVEPKPDKEKSIKKSVDLKSKASELYYGTSSVPQNKKKAVQMYENAVKKGDEKMMYEYGRILLIENPSSSEGKNLVRQAADLGFPNAAIYLADNILTTANEREKYYLKALDYEVSNDVHFKLGEIYAQNPDKRIEALNQFKQSQSTEGILSSALLLLENPSLYNNNYGYVIQELNEIEPDQQDNYILSRQLLGGFAFLGLGMNPSIENATDYWSVLDASQLPDEINIIMAAKFAKDPDSLAKYINNVNIDSIETDAPLYGDISVIDLLEMIPENFDQYSKARKKLGEFAYNGQGMNKNTDQAIRYWMSADPSALTSEENLIMGARFINDPERLKTHVAHVNLSELTADEPVYGDITVFKLLRKTGSDLLRQGKENVTLGFNCLATVYALGDRDQITLSNIAKALKDGEGVQKNHEQAKALMQESVERYHEPRDIRWLGSIYEEEKDYANAEKYYLMGVESDDPISKGFYATLLSKKGKSYFPEAEKYWLEAAQAGHKQSMKNLVILYEKAMPDAQKAAYWKKKLQQAK